MLIKYRVLSSNHFPLLLLFCLPVLLVCSGCKPVSQAKDTIIAPPVEIPKPSISDFAPKSGTMNSMVTITGKNFSAIISNNTIKLNELIATVTSATANEIKFIVPEGANTGKISLISGSNTSISTDNFTVADFDKTFVVKGLYVEFDRRGISGGYYTGQLVKELNNQEPSLGHSVADEVNLQLDEMKKLGVNTIVLELRTSDPDWNGGFEYPTCNIHVASGLNYPVPTSTEISNLIELFDLVNNKQIKIMLRLVNNHMEEQPIVNNPKWINSILSAVKNHPALDLVLFEGNTKFSDSKGDGVNDQCGVPAEPPLWMGPTSVAAKYVKWAIQYAISLGLPPRKLSAECVIGYYLIDSETPGGGGRNATDQHLWKTTKVMKQIFNDLGIPEADRTYAVSFYDQRKCESAFGVPCTDEDPVVWADETWKGVFEIIGRNNFRVVAVEMGLNKNSSSWTTAQAFESQMKLYKRYGVAGGCFWRWVFHENSENQDQTLSTPIKKRGLTFEYNPVKDKMAQYYLGN